MTADDFWRIAEFFDRAVEIAMTYREQVVGKKLKDYFEALSVTTPPGLPELRKEVEEFAMYFPTIGFDAESMRYPEGLK